MKPRVAKKGKKGMASRTAISQEKEKDLIQVLSPCDRMTHCKRREQNFFLQSLECIRERNLGEMVPPQKCEIKCFNLKTNFDSQMYNTFSRIPLANLYHRRNLSLAASTYFHLHLISCYQSHFLHLALASLIARIHLHALV